MFYTITNAAILFALFILLCRTFRIEQRLDEATTKFREADRYIKNLDGYINALTKDISTIQKYANHSQTAEQNTIKALTQLCEALNKSFDTQAGFMNHTTFGLQTLAVCMIPFVDEIKECAIEDEEYEKAAECAQILENLIKIVNGHE